MIYVYDGSFEGLLTAVFEVYRTQNFDADITAEKFIDQFTFFSKEFVKTDFEKAERVWNGCRNRISKSFSNEIYYLYLADTINCGNIILKYIMDGFKYGSKIDQHLHFPSVHDAYVLKNKVFLENHRFKGLVRFRKFKNIYLSDIRPDHNILSILFPHFDRRLPKQQWIIRDIGRNIAAIHLDAATQIASYEASDIKVEFNDEYEDIWREFFKSIAIRERINPRLQKQFMPKRYWENLTEKQ